MAGIGRVVLAGALVLLRQRDLKNKHEKTTTTTTTKTTNIQSHGEKKNKKIKAGGMRGRG